MIENSGLFICSGILVVLLVAFDVFQSIIVPRATSRAFRIAPLLSGKIFWPAFRNTVVLLPNHWRPPLLETFAPLNYVLLLLVWLFCFINGFALILYGMGGYVKPPITTLPDALYFASTSFLTLGFGDLVAYHAVTRFVVIAAAAMGLIFMALEISLLFTLQNYLQMREQVINTLTSRAGTPASGLVLLLRYKELNMTAGLGSSFIQWESWVATVLESHRAFPLLIYFRSSNRNDSWMSSMGAILDAATLLSTAIECEKIGEADLFYWLGVSALKSLAGYLDIEPLEQEFVDKQEFSDSLELLSQAGYAVKSADECMEKFALKRYAYMRYLIPLAQRFVVPVPELINALPIYKATRAAGLLTKRTTAEATVKPTVEPEPEARVKATMEPRGEATVKAAVEPTVEP
jgi:hypothetical protein